MPPPCKRWLSADKSGVGWPSMPPNEEIDGKEIFWSDRAVPAAVAAPTAAAPAPILAAEPAPAAAPAAVSALLCS